MMPKGRAALNKINDAKKEKSRSRGDAEMNSRIASSHIMEIDDLCKYLNIGKNTAYNLLLNGEIDSFKVGSVWKIPSYSVNDYIARKCRESKLVKMYTVVNPQRDLFYEKNGYIPIIN